MPGEWMLAQKFANRTDSESGTDSDGSSWPVHGRGA